MLKTATTNANSWTGLESVSPHFKCKAEAVQKLSGAAFERNLLFPLISLENLVKIGRCNSNAPGFFLRRVAQIPHCFHSCLARRTRLKVGGEEEEEADGAATINSCVKMRNEKQKGIKTNTLSVWHNQQPTDRQRAREREEVFEKKSNNRVSSARNSAALLPSEFLLMQNKDKCIYSSVDAGCDQRLQKLQVQTTWLELKSLLVPPFNIPNGYCRAQHHARPDGSWLTGNVPLMPKLLGPWSTAKHSSCPSNSNL